MQRLAISLVFLALAFCQTPTQFQATFVEYNNPLVIGTMNGTINYDGVGLFLFNEYLLPGGNIFEYFDFNKHLRYLYCGTVCDAQTWTTAIPTYTSNGLTATGNQQTINGNTCAEFTVGGGNPVSSVWTNVANALPCRAVYSTGMTVDFFNLAPLNSNVFAVVPSWNCPAQQCNRLMDIVLIFDESGSITPPSFVNEVQFGTSVAQNFVFGPNAVGMALIQFSGSARESIRMTYIQQSFVNSMSTVIQLGGSTCIGCGISLAYTEVNTYGRANVARVFIMLTDGMNNVGSYTSILQTVKAAGILVVAIGVGPLVDQNQISGIATSPATAFPQVASFQVLNGILSSLITATCIAIPATPCGTACHGFCACKATCVCPSTCNDGNLCHVGSCTPGVYGSGCTYAPTTCNDGNLCTQDLCLPATGCYFPNITCTAPDICHTATCNPSLGCQFPPVQCISNSPCYSSTCVVSQGGCVNTTLPCNLCLGPPAVTCPTILCSNNVCDGKTGKCVATPISCDDGNLCTNDYCDLNTGLCYHNLTVCNDNNLCTFDQCNPQTGCTFIKFNATDCDDHNVCTVDSCDPAVGCVHTNISCASNNTCIADTCDPIVGCLHAPFDCLTVPRIAKFIGTCYSAYCNPNVTSTVTTGTHGCLLTQLPGTVIDTCGVCNGNNGCKNLVQLPSNVPLAIAGGSLAAIVVGAVILFVAIAAFGGKKGYDIWLAHRNNMSGASANPLYNDSGMTGRNPMYSSRV